MESRFVCLVMLGLVAAMVAARLWVERRDIEPIRDEDVSRTPADESPGED